MISASQDRKTSVLVIDDDQKLCRLIKEYLEPLGYKVQMTHTGTGGLAMALEGKFDVAILDLMLLGLNGWEVFNVKPFLRFCFIWTSLFNSF
jgi:DNA-binding response OmpR family regulator